MGKKFEVPFECADMIFDFDMIEHFEQTIIKYSEDERRNIDNFPVDENSEYNPIQDMCACYEAMISLLYASLAVTIVSKTEIHIKKFAVILADKLKINSPSEKSPFEAFHEFIKNNKTVEYDRINSSYYKKYKELREIVNWFKHDTKNITAELIEKCPSYFTKADANKEVQYHKIITHEDITNARRFLRCIINVIYG